jgi:dihydroorotase
MLTPLHLKNGRIIDPAQKRDAIGDLHLLDGKVVEPQSAPKDTKWTVIDCTGKIISPGLIDVHVHLREPGQSAKETMATGTRCAASGGFTTVVCMPNTNPPADNSSTIAWIKQRAEETALVNVYPTGCISQGMKGEFLAPIGSLQKAGVVAITDDGHCVQNNELMRRALEYATMFGLPIFDHCQDSALSANGVMNEGYWSTTLGLQGWPAIAEEIIVGRNALLAEMTGATVLCQHLSSAGSVRLVREARSRGVKLLGEAMPHHLALTDESIKNYDTNFKMNPPLRTVRDQDALKQGLADNVITILASDHAPHCTFEKEVEFDYAPFGVLGLETELAIFLKTLLEPKVLDWSSLLEKLTINPARLVNLTGKGTLAVGSDADVTVIDPDLEWTVRAAESESLSRNTCFEGMELRGRSIVTIVGGAIVWQR